AAVVSLPCGSAGPGWSVRAGRPNAGRVGSSWPAAGWTPSVPSPRCSPGSRTSGAVASTASTHSWRRPDMPVTDVTTDPDTRTITITAHFAAPVDRVWALYADPRQLEKVWGPPTHPATFVEHALEPGGRMSYYMTGPEGERYGGWWEITEVDKPRSFRFRDGFADTD